MKTDLNGVSQCQKGTENSGNFTGYSTPPLENVELNFCKTKPGAQSPGIII